VTPVTDPQPDLWVLVVTFRSADVIEGCLRALPAALEGCGRVGVIVVDNASTDQTVEVVGRVRPDAPVVQTGANLGYAAAINRGLDAVGPVTAPVLVLNPDVRMAPGSVGPMLKALVGRVGVVVPRLRDLEGDVALSLRRAPRIHRALGEAVLGGHLAGRRGWGELVVDPAAYGQPHAVEWAAGAAWLLSAECLRETGLWDESFILYSEETDFALRARDRGFVVWFEPAAEAVHAGGERMTSPALYSLMTLNRVRAFRKRHRRSAAAFRMALLLGELARSLRTSPVHRAAVRALVTGRATLPQSNVQ